MLNTILILFRTIFLVLGGYEQVALENLALRQQLVILRRNTSRPGLRNRDRLFWVVLSHLWRDWHSILVIVKPETVVGWHRKGFKLFWRWRSRVGRPRLPESIRNLIVQMIEQNPTWGEEPVAAELSVKLGILVSPRTIRAYWPPAA